MVRLACWVKPPSTVIMIPFWGQSWVPLCLHSTALIPTPWNWAVRMMDSAGAADTIISEDLTSAGTAQDRERGLNSNTKVINIVGKTEPQVKMRWWQITNKNCTVALFPALHLLSLYGASYSNQFHMLWRGWGNSPKNCIVFEAFTQCTCQRVTKRSCTVLLQPYLLQVMYYDISIPDSFMYTCYRIMYPTFLGIVPDIQRPLKCHAIVPR